MAPQERLDVLDDLLGRRLITERFAFEMVDEPSLRYLKKEMKNP